MNGIPEAAAKARAISPASIHGRPPVVQIPFFYTKSTSAMLNAIMAAVVVSCQQEPAPSDDDFAATLNRWVENDGLAQCLTIYNPES